MVTTTENMVEAATSVVLRMMPLTTIVCALAAWPAPEYVTSKWFMIGVKEPKAMMANVLQDPKPIAPAEY